MKTISIACTAAMILVVALLVAEMVCLYVIPQLRTVHVGQVWGLDDRDPFRKEETLMRVVAVKNDYVAYYFVGQEGYGEDAKQSEPLFIFKAYQVIKEETTNCTDCHLQEAHDETR